VAGPSAPSAGAVEAGYVTKCEICGAVEDAAGHLKHDDVKHAEVAKARRAEKKKAAELPLDGGA
jgi:hypothetical protein